MSPPAQNARPEPVTKMTRTSGSAPRSSNAARSALMVPQSIGFVSLGRFIVTQPAKPGRPSIGRRSTSTDSAGPALVGALVIAGKVSTLESIYQLESWELAASSRATGAPAAVATRPPHRPAGRWLTAAGQSASTATNARPGASPAAASRERYGILSGGRAHQHRVVSGRRVLHVGGRPAVDRARA